MGTAEREYSRGGVGGGLFSQLTPVVKWLLIANIGIFFADLFLFGHGLRRFGAFSVPSALGQLRLWEFVTFQFLHGGLGHVLFNSIGLFFFGPWIERHLGQRRFIAFYLLCGAAGAAFYSLLVVSGFLPSSLLVGASAGIYGILIGVAVIAPDLRVALLIPPIELSMRTLALVILGIAAGSVIFRIGGNAGGEAGHLGGAILGFFLIRHPALLAWAERRSPEVEMVRPRAFRQRSRAEAKLRPRTTVELEQASEVDRILDKISRDGFQSLTEAERETLLNASRSNKDDR